MLPFLLYRFLHCIHVCAYFVKFVFLQLFFTALMSNAVFLTKDLLYSCTCFQFGIYWVWFAGGCSKILWRHDGPGAGREADCGGLCSRQGWSTRGKRRERTRWGLSNVRFSREFNVRPVCWFVCLFVVIRHNWAFSPIQPQMQWCGIL